MSGKNEELNYLRDFFVCTLASRRQIELHFNVYLFHFLTSIPSSFVVNICIFSIIFLLNLK